MPPSPGPCRLIELLAALSLAPDAGNGFAPETTIATTVVAAGFSRLLGHDDEVVRDVIYGSLLRHLGCSGFAVEEAATYGAGDDISLRSTMAMVDFPSQPADAVARIHAGFAPEAPSADRAAAIGALLEAGPAAEAAHHAAQCDAGEQLAALLPVPAGARVVTSQAFERWDGQGGPAGIAGDDLALVTRVVEIAYVATLFTEREAPAVARDAVAHRAGTQLDPALAEAFVAHWPELVGPVVDPARSRWDLLLDAEPAPVTTISAAQVERLGLAYARFADLKSAWFAGHSEAVARRARDAGIALGLPAEDVATLHLAGLLHDLGRVAVTTGVWDAPRALSPIERHRVSLHAWETARILSMTPLLTGAAALAGAAHERLDGTGYHRGARAGDLDTAARILAAADVATAMGESRAHRPASAPATIAAALADEVGAGRLDRAAVGAVLDATGGLAAARPPALTWPAGLTDREVEVVRLVATGATNKDIARALGISARTAAHHVAHIYDKTGCRSRAGTTLFALDHGLVGPDAPRS